MLDRFEPKGTNELEINFLDNPGPEETETQMVWPHLKILWHGEYSSARDNERSKKERKKEKEMGR